MKKALKLLLIFLVFLLSGMILGTIFYSLYFSSLNLVAGKETVLFSKENLIAAFFISGELLTLFLGFLLISYRIRHPGGILQLVSFIITQAICWVLLFPAVFYLEDYYISKQSAVIEQEEKENQLSKGLFRVYDDTVYYFVDDLKPTYHFWESGTTTIKIDSSENGTVEILKIKNSDKLDIETLSEPYKDILIKKTFSSEKPTFLSFFYIITDLAKENFHKGWSFWFGFISLGFALGCIYAVSSLSEWRLINFSIDAILAAGILYWNYIYTTPVFAQFRQNNFVKMNIGALNKYVNNPFLIATNLLIGILLILAGIINLIIKKRRSI